MQAYRETLLLNACCQIEVPKLWTKTACFEWYFELNLWGSFVRALLPLAFVVKALFVTSRCVFCRLKEPAFPDFLSKWGRKSLVLLVRCSFPMFGRRPQILVQRLWACSYSSFEERLCRENQLSRRSWWPSIILMQCSSRLEFRPLENPAALLSALFCFSV